MKYIFIPTSSCVLNSLPPLFSPSHPLLYATYPLSLPGLGIKCYCRIGSGIETVSCHSSTSQNDTQNYTPPSLHVRLVIIASQPIRRRPPITLAPSWDPTVHRLTGMVRGPVAVPVPLTVMSRNARKARPLRSTAIDPLPFTEEA